MGNKKNKEKTDLSPVILGDSTSITKPHKPKPRCISQYLLNDRSCREQGAQLCPMFHILLSPYSIGGEI